MGATGYDSGWWIRSKRDKPPDMQQVGNSGVGTMPILAPDGGHQLDPTDRLNLRLGGDNRRPYFSDFCGSPPVERARGIPTVAGTTMVEDCPDQTELIHGHGDL